MIQPREARLFNVSDVRVSTVDKHTNEGEQAVRLCNYVDVYKNEVILNDFDFMPATCTPDEIARFRLAPGDVVFTKDSETADDIGIPAFVETSAPDLVCGYHVAIATPHQDLVDPKFLFWYLNSRPAFAWWETRASGVTRVGLRQEDIRHLPLGALPPMSHQRAIADFLDRETAQIDAMIEAQERVVARLTERRSSTITTLVTGHALGLPLTASGNPLLGEVPEGWEVGRFGRHTRINGGQVDPGTEPWNEMILVAPNHVESGTGRLLALETAAEQGADSGKYLVRKGQIIYSKIRPSLNKVTIAPQDVLCSADMYGITCLGEGDHRYFANFMLATPFHQYATMVSDRVKMPKINREELSAAPWLVPPMAEQTRIADLVDATTRELDTAISETRTLSALLHERREALITAAVTGRIDPATGVERIDPTTEREAS